MEIGENVKSESCSVTFKNQGWGCGKRGKRGEGWGAFGE